MEHKKLETRQEEQSLTQQQSVQQGALEFHSPEELIRHDMEQTQVPPRLARRLSDSLAREGRLVQSWWGRLWRRLLRNNGEH